MVRWLILILLIPVVFAAMKPVAGISEISGTVTVYVNTSYGLCETIPVGVIGETYTTNLANLRFPRGGDCSTLWKTGDTIYASVGSIQTSSTTVSAGTTVQRLPELILSESTVEEVIERNRREPEVIFVPVEKIEEDNNEIIEEQISIPSRAIGNITETIKYSVSDLYYRTVESESESESVWRYLILIIFTLLLFIGWGVRS